MFFRAHDFCKRAESKIERKNRLNSLKSTIKKKVASPYVHCFMPLYPVNLETYLSIIITYFQNEKPQILAFNRMASKVIPDEPLKDSQSKRRKSKSRSPDSSAPSEEERTLLSVRSKLEKVSKFKMRI